MSEVNNEQQEKQHMYRHSMAHVLAKALMELYPKTMLTIGPAIEDGFYYDIDLEKSLTPDDFGIIEEKMKNLEEKKFQNLKR